MSILPTSAPSKKLKYSITSTSSSFKLNDIKGWKRNALGQFIDLVAADFGTQHFVTFRNDTGSKFEIMEIDPATIPNNSTTGITILKRGLDFAGDQTESATNKLDWSANETTVNFGTDTPQLIKALTNSPDSGSGSPSSTPSFIGQIYVDTTAGNAYVATGTSSSADWKLISAI